MKFLNKCEVCSHMNGCINPKGQPWSGNIRVDCELGIRSTLVEGCKQFAPNISGCSNRCFHYHHNSEKCNKGHNTRKMHNCLDYVIEDDDYSQESIDSDRILEQEKYFKKQLPYTNFSESEIDDIINLYKKYNQEKIKLAWDDDDKLNAHIHLTSSNIKFSPEVNNLIFNPDMDEIGSKIKGNEDIIATKTVLQSNKELLSLYKFLELYYHESIHLIQKHIYSSVYSYIQSVQAIESLELGITQDLLQKGFTFNAYTGFIESCYKYLENNCEDYEKYILLESIKENCSIALEVTKSFSNRLTFIHLIEAQAVYISRLYLGIDNFETPKNNLYNLAWDEFNKFGGKNPIVFILIIDASLRYGGLKTDIPHPVEIFNALIPLSQDLEKLFELTERAVENAKFVGILPRSYAFEIFSRKPVSQESDENQRVCKEKLRLVEEELSTFVDKIVFKYGGKLSELLKDKFFNALEDAELFYNNHYKEKVSKVLDSYFKDSDITDLNSPEYIFWVFSRQISKVLESYLYNSEKNISEVMDFYDDNIMHNVAYIFKKHFQNYKCIDILFPFMFPKHQYYEEHEDVYKKVTNFFAELDDITLDRYDNIPYPIYQEIVKMPEVIKNILSLSSGENLATNGIYCCEKHSYIMYDDMNQLFEHLDSCEENDSPSRALCEIFNKESILDFFSFDNL